MDRTPFTSPFFLYTAHVQLSYNIYYVSFSILYSIIIYFLIANLVKLVEITIRLEYQRSPNRPIYLVRESLGGSLALSVATRNRHIDLVLILENPGIFFSF